MRATAVLVLAVLVLCASAAPVATGVQTPGSGWMLATPSPFRTVKSLFWEMANQTEVWVRLAPRSPKGEPIPAELVFSARYRGNLTKPEAIVTTPDELTLLAQGSPMVFHVSLALTFVLNGGRTVDLLAPPAIYRTGSPCDTCGPTSVRATLDPKVLVDLGTSATVTANVLGMPCELDRADLEAVAQFARDIKVLK
jgi:hypothetical protein